MKIFFTPNIAVKPTNAASETNFAPSEGQVLKARVESVGSNGLVTLRVGSFLLQGHAETSLFTGQDLNLIVRESSQNKLHFQILTQGEDLAGEVVRSMGLPVDNLSSMLIQRLLFFKIPLDKSLVMALYGRLKASEHSGFSVSSDDVDSYILLFRRGLPLSEELSNLVKNFISQPRLLGIAWGNFLREYEGYEQASSFPFLPGELEEAGLVTSYGLSYPAATEDAAKSIRTFLTIMGMDVPTEKMRSLLNEGYQCLLQKKLLSYLQENEKTAKLQELAIEGLKLLTASQIVGAGIDKSDNSTFLFFSLPITFNGEDIANSIKVYYREPKERNHDEMRKCKIVIFLETKSLSKLQIALFLQEELLSCKILAKDKKVAVYMEKYMPQLKEQLTAGGFVVKKIECKHDPLLDEEQMHSKYEYKTVDYKI